MEASFFVTEDSLKRIQPDMRLNEAGLLAAFDLNRLLIYATAAKVRCFNVKFRRVYRLNRRDRQDQPQVRQPLDRPRRLRRGRATGIAQDHGRHHRVGAAAPCDKSRPSISPEPQSLFGPGRRPSPNWPVFLDAISNGPRHGDPWSGRKRRERPPMPPTTSADDTLIAAHLASGILAATMRVASVETPQRRLRSRPSSISTATTPFGPNARGATRSSAPNRA
jgi:hypothetical protein